MWRCVDPDFLGVHCYKWLDVYLGKVQLLSYRSDANPRVYRPQRRHLFASFQSENFPRLFETYCAD
jgi:hypothetical protein